jgi:hypothetical protein
VTQTRVSFEVKQELDRIAAEEQRSLSQVVAMIIAASLEARRRAKERRE